MATPIKFRAEVIRVIRHGADVATYEFRCLDLRPRFKPGQFLHLALDPYNPSSYWPDSRALTIANGATNRECIRLTIAAKGAFTHRMLRELEVGRHVWMKAPYGEFIVDASNRHEVVLIAGGTGVTPFVAFMEDALVTGLPGEVWLHYGARHSDLLVFAELAARCAAKFPSFHTRLYAESGVGKGMVPGRIDLDAACGLLQSPSNAVFYLCGPQLMIEAFSARLVHDYGILGPSIRVDQWE
jgi:ferredoxin-NADP reductase